jgi:mRNA-degrading endonuclease YafQ of YafQ-DinJ toxin-antitoxin module
MRRLAPTARFSRAFRRLVKKNPAHQAQIEEALRRMAADLSDSRLKIHHLSGKLKGLFACSCGYDCRIVFAKERDARTGTEVLLLLNIGSHAEVY